MGRVWKTLRAVDAGDGVYHADVTLAKATHWTLVVHVAAAHNWATSTRNLEVR